MAIFTLIFIQVECTIDNAFNLRDLLLQELVKIIEYIIQGDKKVSVHLTITIPTQLMI